MGIVTPEPIRDAHFDTRIIAELRALRALPRATPSFTITPEELDALLAAADERDALKREATDDPTPRYCGHAWNGPKPEYHCRSCDAHFDTRMIDDLRALRALPRVTPSFTITPEELDALLAAADERDALKREATDDVRRVTPTTLTARAGDTLRVTARHPRDPAPGRLSEPVGVVLSSDTTITVERARLAGTEGAEAVCACGVPLRKMGTTWFHADPDAPRDCIALPVDHPSRATPADDSEVATCGSCDRRIIRPEGWVSWRHVDGGQPHIATPSARA